MIGGDAFFSGSTLHLTFDLDLASPGNQATANFFTLPVSSEEFLRLFCRIMYATIAGILGGQPGGGCRGVFHSKK